MREVLLVEDSDADADLLERALRAVEVANPIRRFSDGAQALAYFKAHENSHTSESELPFILFLDLKLPRASGFEILGYLQMSWAFRQLLKIVVSELDNLESIRTAYSLGAGSFLCKPIHRQDLRDLIKAYPQQWEMEAATKVS
jgi:two-component system response regulator